MSMEQFRKLQDIINRNLPSNLSRLCTKYVKLNEEIGQLQKVIDTIPEKKLDPDNKYDNLCVVRSAKNAYIYGQIVTDIVIAGAASIMTERMKQLEEVVKELAKCLNVEENKIKEVLSK